MTNWEPIGTTNEWWELVALGTEVSTGAGVTAVGRPEMGGAVISCSFGPEVEWKLDCPSLVSRLLLISDRSGGTAGAVIAAVLDVFSIQDVNERMLLLQASGDSGIAGQRHSISITT